MHLLLLVIKVIVVTGYTLFAVATAAPTGSSNPGSEKLPTLQQVLNQLEKSEGNGVAESTTGAAQAIADSTNGTRALAQQRSDTSNTEQSLEALASGAGDFIRNEHKSAERVEVAVTPVDRRLRLKRCETSPVFSWTSATSTMGNTSITAACEGTAPWKVLVRARVSVYQHIPVLVAPVNKGDVLLADIVDTRLMDVSTLRRETIRSIDHVVGYQFKRQLAAGREISSSVLVAPKVISKGDLVLISASNQLIDVQMKGIALAGGTVGKKIKVRSNSSGRVIQTWIKGPGQVEVSP